MRSTAPFASSVVRQLGLLVLIPATLAAQESDPAAGGAAFEVPDHAVGFVEVHCFDCHGDGASKGDLDLEKAPADAVDALWRWRRLRDRVAAHEMPPLEESYVTAEERERFVAWVDGLLLREVPALPPDAGSVTIRRLSRGQWHNSVHDLFGVDVDTGGLPADDLGYGFDTIGDALSFSTLHLEKYLALAEQVAGGVYHGERPGRPERRTVDGEALSVVGDSGVTRSGGVANMYTNATVRRTVALPRDGVYSLRIEAHGKQAGDEAPCMVVSCDGEPVARIEVPNDESRPFEFELSLRGGRHRIELSFVNDYYAPDHPDPARRDRNLLIDAVEVVGPIDARPVPEQQRWLLDGADDGGDDEARLGETVSRLATTLWRGRAPSEAVRRLLDAGRARLSDGEDLDSARRLVLTAALASPWFLFRPEPEGPDLAGRLAFFLWASAPDAALLRFGSRDDANDAAALAAQVDDMLADPRSERLATEFAAQWLELRGLGDCMPDPERFPGFDDGLRASLRTETELLFATVLREGRDVRELLDCDFTFLDERLATHYGIERQGEPGEFVRVTLAGDDLVRGGLLGHASVQAITSNPTRTSPVKRGKWLLDNLLGQAPPPPPPGSDSFADEEKIDDSATLREQMEQHRSRSKCAVCHVRMDALGLSMQRFDAIGRFRASDAAGAIDASGELPDGRRLEGLPDLKQVLAQDPAFVRTVAKKLFVYANGRDLRPVDHLRIDHAVAELRARGDRPVTLKDLILTIVLDPAFRGVDD